MSKGGIIPRKSGNSWDLKIEVAGIGQNSYKRFRNFQKIPNIPSCRTFKSTENVVDRILQKFQICLRMLEKVPECYRTLQKIQEYFRMSENVIVCSRFRNDILKCLRWFQKVIEYSRMIENILKCTRMFWMHLIVCF